MGRHLGLALTPLLLLLASWGVWRLGGTLLERLGLDALDLPGRFCLVILFLCLAEGGLARLPAQFHSDH